MLEIKDSAALKAEINTVLTKLMNYPLSFRRATKISNCDKETNLQERKGLQKIRGG